jgi:hypothetical protein
MDNLLFYVQWFTIMWTDEGGGDGFDGAGEKDPAGKSNLRVSCDSMNCIRFDGYNLSPAALAEHPNRNEALLMSSDGKSKLFDQFSQKVMLPRPKNRGNHWYPSVLSESHLHTDH